MSLSLKVCLNSREYLSGFTFTEFPDEPFNRIAIGFRIITAVYAVAQGNDVPWNSSGATRISEGNPMIRCNGMPKSLWATTYRTAIAKIIQCVLPIDRRKGNRQGKFTSLSAMLPQKINLRTIRTTFVNLIMMLSFINDAISRMFFTVNATVSCYFLLMCTSIEGGIGVRLFTMRTAINGMIEVITRPTPSAQSSFISAEIFKIRKIFIAAFCAASKRIGDIQHSVSLSLHHIWSLENGVICRLVRRPSLSSMNIIPLIGGTS